MLSHKKVAYLAGLGWIGRNNLLVNERLGARFRLSCVLTDMPLEADRPVESGCGACRACVESCPCRAIGETPSDFDHRKCFAQLKEFQKKRYVEQFICGVCVRACGGKGKKP
jgi:epoxyqueuosine reductase QueG